MSELNPYTHIVLLNYTLLKSLTRLLTSGDKIVNVMYYFKHCVLLLILVIESGF
jgi:hypothetical protein